VKGTGESETLVLNLVLSGKTVAVSFP